MRKAEYIEKYGEEAYKRRLEQQKEYRKQYYQQNKEQELKLQKKWKEQHKEQHKEYLKQYREQHKEDRKEYLKQHIEQQRQYRQKWNRKNICMFAFCLPEEIEQIENYELAKKDNFKGWCIHHRLECVETGAVVNSSMQELKDWGIYFNRPASELIFLTKSEHRKLHSRIKNMEGCN